MAGLPWIELDVDMPTHPKSIRLGRKLGNPLAWAHVVQLWTWCARYLPTGDIEGDDASGIVETAAGWDGKPGRFVEAALTVGYLDRLAHGYRVHGWADRAAPHVAKRERDAERLRNRRAEAAKNIGKVVNLSPGRSGDDRAT